VASQRTKTFPASSFPNHNGSIFTAADEMSFTKELQSRY